MCPFFTNELILACSNWIVASVASRFSGNEFALLPRKVFWRGLPYRAALVIGVPRDWSTPHTKCGGTKLSET